MMNMHSFSGVLRDWHLPPPIMSVCGASGDTLSLLLTMLVYTRHRKGTSSKRIDARSLGTLMMTWKARISQVKWIPSDAYVGYGCTYQTTRRTRLAILPTGYADGYDRKLSSAGHVLVRGRRAPVLGRICMNLTMIDVTDIPNVQVEDEAVLLGRQGDQEITAEQLASIVGTIPYEIVARIAPHMPRLVVA